ncbi:unnamed protein product [Kuraishia capsulata CBS 1993]|uniref:Phosphoribosylaminoimidazole-succinocarboxamide synthase n=1 Tax=Kuraishia capsulata CBS 1993 TaxID=1382522 RepID=W6MX25_9ASCO|nr:uncharacterized protein KUCA_T00004136001 [Kuraishia capsulata CBS 1993]CDK28155.1 unnamed protein product [Kuraishia capsulata CBS 1993]
MSITSTELDGILPLLAKGKVRDIYSVDAETLLFVATDRISAYDVIMENGVTDKGKLLTQLSVFWFKFLAPFVKTHIVASDDADVFARLPSALSAEPYRSQLAGRSLIVQKYQLIPLEVIVRGYITGSAWKEYVAHGTVHGLAMPAGLLESSAFPEPIFTPSTKADLGAHDENISPEAAAELVGKDICDRVAAKAIELYSKARAYAETKGIVIADTKFEFGVTPTGELVLVDEVLTPDSSRFWSKATYAVGRGQDSYDKQFLRDWLTANKLNGKEGVAMTAEIEKRTAEKYIEAYEALTGEKW